MAAILLTGKLWVRVPEIVKIEITGAVNDGIMGKDIILYVLRRLRADGAVYKAVEFAGPLLANMSLEQRAVLTNMSVEMGAKASFISIDALTTEEIKRRTARSYTIPVTDSDYEYVELFSFDLSQLEPQVALPGAVDNVVEVKRVLGTPIDQAYIGGCTGGSFEDIEAAAHQLCGKAVRKGVRLIVSPASRSIYLRALEAGYIAEIVRGGGTMINPGCGPCLGVHQGILAPGEVCVSSASRNFPGRMGSTKAEIYLTSSATAAASAVEGVIALPIKETR
jgi:3-isopropylmalate/(R)-2-methylmalate dehydratase large subunit